MSKPESESKRWDLLDWLPLRIRISLWVLAIYLVVHVTIMLVVLLFHRQSVESRIRTDLSNSITQLTEVNKALATSGSLLTRVSRHPKAAQWGPLAVIIYDNEGHIIASQGPYDEEEFNEITQHTRTLQTTPDTPTFDEDPGDFFYAVMRLDDEQRIAVAAPSIQIKRAVSPVANLLLLSLPIGLISTGVATWYISGVAVRPIHQMQTFAEELSAETLSRGIELDDSSPETELLREELEAALDRLGQGYERQARFLANVSHELKTPISVIRTEAEVLLASDSNLEDYKSFAHSTSEEMNRLGRMIESFLLLTRVRQGSTKIKAKQHNANDILMEAIGSCLSMAEQYKVPINPILYDGDEDLTVEGNAELLETSIANLIRNAIRFSPQGKPLDVICAKTKSTARFKVRDYGPGVPENLIDRIFEPFTQSDDERRRGRGTGLGLQIAQGIAELHGGTIKVENLDEGCQFSIRLPRKIRKSPPNPQT